MARRPRTAWCAAINLSGVMFSTPWKGTWNTEINGYWDEIGNDCCDDLGQIESDGHVTFASPEKSAVEAWLAGALAAVRMVHQWSETPPAYVEYVKEFDGG